jgi:acid stress-induced BolA-like protein IbaG/YrbA
MKTTDLLGENISLVTPTKVTEPDHEVQMARSDLYKAGKYAIDLHNMLKTVGEAHGLEGWVQAKITKAADYLESVYHYLDYEMKSRGAMAEGAPTGPSGPIPPGAVPVGGAVGPSVAPAQAAAMAAKGRIDQKKAIESKIKDLEMQKQQLQRQLAQAGQVQETTSAGAIASSMGGNGLGKSKTEVGSLFGGTYKTKKKLKGAPHSNAPRLGVAESANTLFDVTVIDPKTGNEKTMEISALTATEAKSKVAGKTVEVDGERKHYKVISVKSAWNEAANPAQQAAIAISMKKAGKKPKMKEDEEQSSYPTDAPIGTKYGSFRTPGGVKMNKFTGPDMVPDIKPARLGAPKARFPVDAPVGTKYGSFTDKETGERMDKYVGHELTTHFQPASKGPWLPKVDSTPNKGTPAYDEPVQERSEAKPKFTGYYKGTDKGKPGKKMVGGD